MFLIFKIKLETCSTTPDKELHLKNPKTPDPIRSFSWLFGSVKMMRNFREVNDREDYVQKRLNGWSGLPFWMVDTIQNSCERVFKEFGYKKLTKFQYSDLKTGKGKGYLKMTQSKKREYKNLPFTKILEIDGGMKEFYRHTLPGALIGKYGMVENW